MIRATDDLMMMGFSICLLFLTGCATSLTAAKIDDATAQRLRAEITVYDSNKLKGIEYKTIKQIHTTVCGNRENGMAQLRYMAYQAGANGITKINCGTLLGPSMIQNCLTTSMCEAVAITVGQKDAEPERAWTEKAEAAIVEGSVQKQVLPGAEGFTLGKLPLVVTNYNSIGHAKEFEIIFSGNYVTKGKILRRDEKNNLAIISFEEFRRMPVGFPVFPSYKVRVGQKVYALGSGQTITEGVISGTDGPGGDSRYFRISSKGDQLGGGEPLLDFQGRVIGIVLPASAKTAEREPTQSGTYFAIKSTAILNLYPEIEDLVTSEPGPDLSPKQISDAFGNSVVTLIAK